MVGNEYQFFRINWERESNLHYHFYKFIAHFSCQHRFKKVAGVRVLVLEQVDHHKSSSKASVKNISCSSNGRVKEKLIGVYICSGDPEVIGIICF